MKLNTKIKASKKLYLLVFVMTLFIIGIGLYGINEMRKMNRQTGTLYADRMLPLEQLTKVRTAYLAGIISTAGQANAHQSSATKAIVQIQAAQQTIRDNWSAYMKTYQTPQESKIARDAAQLMAKSDQSVALLVSALHTEDFDQVDQVMKTQLYPTINPVIDKLNELVDIQIRIAEMLDRNNDDVYISAFQRFLIMILLSLVFVIPFSHYLIRNVKELIHDLHLTNAEITRSEEKYRSILEHAGDAIFIVAEDGAIKDVNQSACDLLGYSREELLQKNTYELNAGNNFHRPEIQWDLLRKNETLLDERLLVRKDGSTVEVEISRKILADTNRYIAIVRDITEREKTRKQLKVYKHFFYHSNELSSISSADGYLEILNPQFSKLLGYKEAELLQHQFYHFIHPDDIEATMREVEKLKNGVETVNFVNRYRRADGEYLWLEWNATADLAHNKLYGVTRDVTARKKTEDLLRESEERFSRAFRSAPVSIVVSKISDGTLFEVNKATEKLFNYTREELIGKSTKDLKIWVDENDRTFLVDQLASKGYLHSHDFRFRTKDGRIVIANSSTELIELGGEACFLCVLVDLTENRRMEESLKISEKKYRNIFENAQDVFYQSDEEGRIIEVSPSVLNHIGYTREELIGTYTSNLYYDLADRERGLEILRAEKELSGFEFRLKTKSGEAVYVSLNAKLLYDDDSNTIHVDGVLRNITERKIAEIEKEKMMSDIVTRNKKFEEFSFIVSHNLRSPVAAILGITKMLSGQPTAAERLELEQSLQTSVERLDQVIRVLNEVLQIRTQMTESKENVFLPELVSQIESGIFHLIPGESAEIVTDFEAADVLFSIRSFVRSIFYNLISNSIKFKKPDVDTVISIKTEKVGDRIRIRFRDNGRGLDLEKFGKKLFTLYERFHLDIESNGIGLFMVKNQVEMLGGNINVHSKPGVGTEFVIELPI